MNAFLFTSVINRNTLETIKVCKLFNDVKELCDLKNILLHFENDIDSLIDNNVSDVIQYSVMDSYAINNYSSNYIRYYKQ